MRRITLVFLLYAHEPGGVHTAEGHLDSFVRAYGGCDAGIEHDLLVIFNGFATSDADALDRRLADLEHRGVRFPEDQQDLAAYVRASRDVRTPVVAFLNSHSRPLAGGWLAALHDAAQREDIGLAGATGSYESFRDAARGRQPLTPAGRARHLAWRVARRRDYRRATREFPSFPNPHVRSNAFALRRDVLASLSVGRLDDKIDAQAVESGLASLSRQVTARMLRPVLVGRGGHVYDVPEWPASRTFRSADQENLLVADNRTEQYRLAGADERRRLAALAWGDGAPALGAT